MEEEKNINLQSFKASLRMAFVFFNKRTKNMHMYIIVVALLIMLRTWIDVGERNLRASLSKCGGNYDGALVAFMVMKFWWWNIEFMYMIVFEVLITPIGGLICSFIMERILYSEHQGAMNLSPPQVEYFVTEGSKSIAKIVRLVFINLLDTAFQILGDFWYVFSKDNSFCKWVSSSFIILVSGIASVKLWYMHRSFLLTYEATKINCQKEKCYVETVDSLHIVKSYGEGNGRVLKYENDVSVWERINTKCKLLIYTNNFVFNTCCDVLITISTVRFISMMDFPDRYSSHSVGGDSLFDAAINEVNVFSKVLFYIPMSFIKGIKFYRDLAESVVLSRKLVGYMSFVKEEMGRKMRVDSFNDSIEVRNLMYTAKDKVVFSDISFTVRKGDKCVLFGRNGAGKSSIFKLLLGFEEYRGTILFDGVDLGALCMSDYRRLVTYVPQDTRLFDESIYYNLAFGNDRAYREIIEECKRMGIHDSIMSFPSGYNTSVGMGGKAINGGLRQKIFYTRAFLRDTAIYLFDEPTNNLDVVHAGFLLEYVRDPKYAQKTFFVICHDIDIVREFPKILRFDDGRIVLEKDQCQ